jgi:serine-type D-Ala-D-Ala carboxypeptidase/endopeptidase (penicillin-binding protein 4)
MLNFLFGLINLVQINSYTDSLSIRYKNIFLQKIDSLQHSKTLENGYLAVSIRNCKSGENLIQFNENKALRPASTLKLVTTATALGLLGENYRYKTSLEYNGSIRNDTLLGNLIIKGSGDPTLGSWRFDETLDYSRLLLDWANKIKSLKIKVIKGDIVTDQSVFTDNEVPASWQWGDMGNYYGAAAYSINFNENLFKAFFKTSKKDQEYSSLVKTEPSLSNYDFVNSVIGNKETTGDDVYLFSAPKSYIIYAKGSLPLNRDSFIVKGSIPNPAETMVRMLKNTLFKIDVSVISKDNYFNLLPNKIIDIVQSPSLFEICLNTNFDSINLYAESLLKTISLTEGKHANTENGIEILKRYWEAKGLDLKGLYMKDGSGLSTANAITANNMTDILVASSKEKIFKAFHQGIPVLGRDGTMKNIAKNKEWAKNFSVKSGTIEKVKSFAGYFYNKKGVLMAFSIMANQFEGSESAMSRELAKLFEVMWGLE